MDLDTRYAHTSKCRELSAYIGRFKNAMLEKGEEGGLPL